LPETKTISVLCVDGKPIPCEYVTHGKAKEREALVVRMDSQQRIVEIETDGPFAKEHIVLTGGTVLYEGQEGPVWGPYLGRLEGTAGSDILPADTGLNHFIWINPPQSLFDYQRPGDKLTFFEF